MNFLYQILYGADTVVQCLLLVLLLRGPFRKYVVFTGYVVGALAVDVIEAIAYYRPGWGTPAYRKLYWTDHVTLDLLLFLVVIAFTYAALQGNPLRPKAAKVLVVIVALTLALPLTLLRSYRSPKYGFFTSQWFNHVSQIWNFGAAIMNLVLWTALLSNRRRDSRLVVLSIGVGIVTASAAIAWGVRQWLPQADRWPVDSFRTVTHLASLLLWCWVFRPKAAGHSNSTPTLSTKPPSNAPSPDAITTPS
jgi:hypothetical protein